MGFTLLHAGLAAGAALAVIPIVLHLILKQKPRQELFPALRLIRQRHRVNLKRLKIRHWLLLAMRMLLIALMALALARPSIHGASFIPDQQAPIAAAFVFDTSLSMEHRERGRTRLEQAKEIATGLIKEFPDGSELLVLDSADPTSQFYPDMSLANQRIESLRLRPRATSVNQAIIEACRSLGEIEGKRKEIFVFTDRTAGSLSAKGAESLRQELTAVSGGGAALYILDVGVPTPKNAYIADVRPSAQVIAANTGAIVTATVADVAQGEGVLVELSLNGQIRGSQQLALEKDKTQQVEFRLPRLSPGVHHGKLILRNGGGLEFDDTHYLSLEVRPVTRVLLISDTERDASLLRNALAPTLFVEQQIAWYQVDWLPPTRLAGARLSDYLAVGLIGVQDLPSSRWSELEQYVQSGGGLAVVLGPRSNPESYNGEFAQSLLRLKIGDVAEPREAVGLQVVVTDHPVVAKTHAWDQALFGQTVVERYFRTQPGDKEVRRVLNFTDGSVAMSERTMVGPRAGRVIAFTTPVAPTPARSKPWNDLPGFGALFVPMAQDLFSYLAGHAEQRLNYQVGEDVILRPERGTKLDAYLLKSPDADQATRRSTDPTEGTIVVSVPEALGNYTVTAGSGDQPFLKGFSLNANTGESTLAPMSDSELVAVLGEGSFAVARNADELREVMGDVRIGRELYPWLMPFIVLLFAMEHVLANRFYKRDDARPIDVRHTRTMSRELATADA